MTQSPFVRPTWFRTLAWWLLLSGCAGSPSGPPPINRQQLIGVWRHSQNNFNVIWTFQSDGSLRFQAHPQNAWLRVFGADIDIAGRWTLEGDRLTIEAQETPPQAVLAGQDWSGQQQMFRIKTLTAQELEFYDQDFQFHKSMVPADTK